MRRLAMRKLSTRFLCCGSLFVLGAAAPALANGGNLVLNPHFASSTAGWLGQTATWVAKDATGSPHSGSLLLINPLTGAGEDESVLQCVPATAGPYVAGLSAWVEGTAGDSVFLNFAFFSDTACTTLAGGAANTPGVTARAWNTTTALSVAPPGTHSAKLFVIASRGQSPSGTQTTYVDDVFLEPGTCAPGPTRLCLTGGRFAVHVSFSSPGQSGVGQAVPFADQSGKFWFFAPTSVELDVKVLDGCALNHKYWVFAAGLTNVQVTLTVTDTLNGTTKTYNNAQNHTFTTITDTTAFATCP